MIPFVEILLLKITIYILGFIFLKALAKIVAWNRVYVRVSDFSPFGVENKQSESKNSTIYLKKLNNF